MPKSTIYFERKRIFIGSPNDLNPERKQFGNIVDKINDIKAKSISLLLEPVGWEDTLLGKGRPQKLINKDLKSCDLAVMLLWKRWGSKPSKSGKYTSGFEEEYEVAKKAGIDIWFYFRKTPDDMMADPGEQLKQVLEFRNKLEIEKNYLYRAYESEQHWIELFEKDLCTWIDGIEPTVYKLEKLDDYKRKIDTLKSELDQKENEKQVLAFQLAHEAVKHATEKQFTIAEGKYSTALALYPHPTIRNSYGIMLSEAGVLSKATEQFEMSANMDPNYCLPLYNWGVTLGNQGRYDEAIEKYKKVTETDPQDVKAYNNWGVALGNLGRHDETIEKYIKAIELDPQYVKAYYNWSIALEKLGKIKEALKKYKKVVALDSDGETGKLALENIDRLRNTT